MKRRSFMYGVSASVPLFLSGCADANETVLEEERLQVTEYSFDIIDLGESIETQVMFDEEESIIEVLGEIRVRSGCMSIELTEPPNIPDNMPFTVRLGLESFEESEGICTTAVERFQFRVRCYVNQKPDSIILNKDGLEEETVIEDL